MAVQHGRILAAGAVHDVFTEALMSRLYDARARLSETEDGASIRFTG